MLEPTRGLYSSRSLPGAMRLRFTIWWRALAKRMSRGQCISTVYALQICLSMGMLASLMNIKGPRVAASRPSASSRLAIKRSAAAPSPNAHSWCTSRFGAHTTARPLLHAMQCVLHSPDPVVCGGRTPPKPSCLSFPCMKGPYNALDSRAVWLVRVRWRERSGALAAGPFSAPAGQRFLYTKTQAALPG